MSFDDALAYVQERRMCVLPNAGFQTCLRAFEVELKQLGRGAPEQSSSAQSETVTEL